MRNLTYTLLLLACILLTTIAAGAESTDQTVPENAEQAAVEEAQEAGEMLASLLELQKSLGEQIKLSKKNLKNTKSEAEKIALQEEITLLDKQLSETTTDFERIATGVETDLFTDKKPETFSWKEEMASLIEPAIKELKRFTVRARQKTYLKDRITELDELLQTAGEAVENLLKVKQETTNKQVAKKVEALLPEWLNTKKRLENKLELTQRELDQLTEDEVSFLENSQKSVKNFFKDRGRFVIIALTAFIVILLACRLIYRLFVSIARHFGDKEEQRSFQVRLLDILYRVFSITLAIVGLFFVLYLAEDWFLLSIAIVFFLGLAWTVRQGLPRLWQQGRLMLNVGSVRENERLIFRSVPWEVKSINVFCTLFNPALDQTLRVPIEGMVGRTSRPYHRDEPWFPCKKGDWVIVNNASRARVVSLSVDQVEVVQRGGKRIVYPTDVFLQACPENLSRNYRLRVAFGLDYSLQEQVTSSIPATLKAYIEQKMEEEGYDKTCLNLQAEFYLANASSLDIIVLADFDGETAGICKRIERAIQKWCVECATINNWGIPFPQLTIHKAEQAEGSSN